MCIRDSPPISSSAVCVRVLVCVCFLLSLCVCDPLCVCVCVCVCMHVCVRGFVCMCFCHVLYEVSKLVFYAQSTGTVISGQVLYEDVC